MGMSSATKKIILVAAWRAVDRLLLVLAGAAFFVALICALVLAELVFLSALVSFSAWRVYARRGGEVPEVVARIMREIL
jgi:hypothetical protein